MADKTERALDMVEKAGGKIDGYINALGDGVAAVGAKLGELANQHGSDLLDLALNVYRIQALGELLIGGVLLALLVFSWLFYAKVWWQSVTVNMSDHDRSFARGMAAAFLGVATVFVGIVALIKLTNIWYWVGVFEPKLYVAHLILEKVIK